MAVSPKTLKDLKVGNEYEALHLLGQLLEDIVVKDFAGHRGLREYVTRRVSAAREVLRRRGVKSYTTEREARAVVPSAQALRARGGGKFRALDGGIVVVVADAGEEYSVRVSRYRFKCTCKDSVMLSTIADRRLDEALRKVRARRRTADPVFPRYVLCKHVLATLARAMAAGDFGVVAVDRELVNSLKVAVLGAYLRVEEKPDPRLVSRIYRIVERRR